MDFKDKGLRAKEIAEQKFSSEDIIGARKLCPEGQKARSWIRRNFPYAGNLWCIYHSAEKKRNGETDWHAVLSVDISADIKTIKKQYRKLALMLHPGKSKPVEADGAFQVFNGGMECLIR